MAACENCSAKLLPGQRICKACGEPVSNADARDATDAMLGRTIASNYEIVELLGEGAMGRVYKARQISLDKPVAVKVLHKHLAADPKVTKRFHREARAASRLSHPNSLSIIDFGEDDDGTLYIAMELLDGDDLLTIIENDAPLTPQRIFDLLRQVLSALDTAHHSGIIHRDLKPENVVVLEAPSGEEHVKVCDFGIAKIQEAEGGSAITVTGFVCGTPEYMAPEQARGEELDPRADIYAAGCMLYQMMTGELPFRAESALGIITKHLTETPIPPRERKPEWNIPRSLETVCMKAMSKDREQRYSDAASMSKALEEAVEALGARAREPLGTTRHDSDVDELAPTIETERSRTSEIPVARSRSVGWIAGLVAVGGVAIAVALAARGGEGEAVTRGEGGAGEPRAVEAPPRDEARGVNEATSGADAGAAVAAEVLADAGAALVEATPDAGDVAAATKRRWVRRGATGERGTTTMAGMATMVEPDEGSEPDRTAMTNTAMATTAMTEEPAQSPGQRAYEEGRSRFLANDVAGAIASFEEAASLMPQNAQVHKQLGRAYMRAGNVARASAAYRRYLELAPNAPDRAIVERMIAGD